MTFEYVDWNTKHIVELINAGLTETEFVEQGIRNGQYKKYKTDDQKAMLKEVYRLITEQETLRY